MTLFFFVILLINSIVGCALYFFMRKKSHVFSERYGMMVATCSSGIISLQIGMVCQFLFSLPLLMTTLIATTIGAVFGLAFGSLIKFQSILAGFYHGVTGGIMGAMLGAVIQNPTLCALPGDYFYQISQNMLFFALFGTFLLITTLSLLLYSLKI